MSRQKIFTRCLFILLIPLTSCTQEVAMQIGTPTPVAIAANAIVATSISQLAEGTEVPQPSEKPILTATSTQIPKNTSTPTRTASVTPTPTITPSPTQTSTNIPTATPTSTNTPIPMNLVFNGDYESGKIEIGPSPNQWFFERQDGGTSEIIDINSVFSDPSQLLDSSGKSHGNVMRITIGGPAVSHPDWGGATPGLWRQISQAWQNGIPPHSLSAPCAVQVDLFKSKDLGGGFLSVHRLNKVTEDRISVAGYEFEPNGRIKLLARDGRGNDKRVYLNKDLLEPSGWNTLRLEFLTDGSVVPYINGRLAYQRASDLLKVPVDKSHDAGFIDAHAGYILGGIGGSNSDVPEGSWLLNDNFMIFQQQ